MGRSLPPLTSEIGTSPVSELDDAALLELANSKMDADHNARMSELLYRQQARTISDEEEAELQMLMELFEAGQLRKTQAAVEAVVRGL